MEQGPIAAERHGDAVANAPRCGPSAGPALRLRLFNVKYSPNLGDGLLSECLERALIAKGASADTWSIDLAARTAYGDALTGRRQIMSVLDRMPRWLRQQTIRLPLALHAERKWRPHYAAGLKQASAAVIGGGNLISDIDLNFATKLSLVIEEAERLSVPVIVYAAGVAGNWTSRGMAMLTKAFSSPILKGVYVRDRESKLLWDAKFSDASGHEADIARDPGLLAAEFFPRARGNECRLPVAGIGIMSPIAIRYHAENAADSRYLENWYVELVEGLVGRGFHVIAFTNGSPEDVAYLASLRPQLKAAGRGVISFPTQRTPAELCAVISALDVLVAYRMHAVIAAFSYGVPAIGLAWDRKLHSFMASVGREEFLCDVTRTSADNVIDLACRATPQGIAEQDRKCVLEDTWQGIAKLMRLLESLR